MRPIKILTQGCNAKSCGVETPTLVCLELIICVSISCNLRQSNNKSKINSDSKFEKTGIKVRVLGVERYPTNFLECISKKIGDDDCSSGIKRGPTQGINVTGWELEIIWEQK